MSRERFVYRTLQLYEADLVANEFAEAGIAFHRATEDPAGVRFAMPASPSFFPGMCFLIVVPPVHADRARAILRTLPVSKEDAPGVFPKGMPPEARSFFRTWAVISLLAILVYLLTLVFAGRH